MIRYVYDEIKEKGRFPRTIAHIKKADHHVRRRVHKTTYYVSFVNKKTFILLLHFTIELVEVYFKKSFDYVRGKLPKK